VADPGSNGAFIPEHPRFCESGFRATCAGDPACTHAPKQHPVALVSAVSAQRPWLATADALATRSAFLIDICRSWSYVLRQS
jgi:hypothetical protein